jgi:hypothetical protein
VNELAGNPGIHDYLTVWRTEEWGMVVSAEYIGGAWIADYAPRGSGFVTVGTYDTREEAERHAEALYLTGVWK